MTGTVGFTPASMEMQWAVCVRNPLQAASAESVLASLFVLPLRRHVKGLAVHSLAARARDPSRLCPALSSVSTSSPRQSRWGCAPGVSGVPGLSCARWRRMSEQGKGSVSASAAAPAPGSDTYKGWLFKWTNYLKGYQRRWFVLSNGLLSYYR